MVTQDATISLEEHVANVVELRSLDFNGRIATVPHLIHSLAGSRRARVLANQRLRTTNWRHAAFDELNPSVSHAVFSLEDAWDIVGPARVARVRVAEHDDRCAVGTRLDEVGDLAQVGGAGFQICCRGSEEMNQQNRSGAGAVGRDLPSISVKVVSIKSDAWRQRKAHVGEALGSETVRATISGISQGQSFTMRFGLGIHTRRYCRCPTSHAQKSNKGSCSTY